MNSYLTGSIIYRLISYVGKLYDNSTLKILMDKLSTLYENSGTHRILHKYLNKKSTFQYTLTYRILAWIGEKLDIVAGKLHDFFMNHTESSILINALSGFIKELSSRTAALLITAILSFTAGYSVITTVHGNWSSIKLAAILALCVICLVLGIMSERWKVSIKNSFLNKLYHFIWE